jgi:hypothetical protein
MGWLCERVYGPFVECRSSAFVGEGEGGNEVSVDDGEDISEYAGEDDVVDVVSSSNASAVVDIVGPAAAARTQRQPNILV